jgi:6-phosphogluconolactonase
MRTKQIIICKNPAELAERSAALFSQEAQTRVAKENRFVVAVSGGSTPRATHRLLARKPYRLKVPWEKIHLFWVDERLVPYDHRASNFGAARQDWIENVPIATNRVYPMPVENGPKACAQRYHEQIAQLFPQAEPYPPFDMILLGIGADGHTASLFPGTTPGATEGKWVLPVCGGDPHVDRLTLSFQLINHARHVVFLVTGAVKAEVVKQLIEEGDTRLPASYIRPQTGKLTWLLDDAAASKMNPSAAGK